MASKSKATAERGRPKPSPEAHVKKVPRSQAKESVQTKTPVVLSRRGFLGEFGRDTFAVATFLAALPLTIESVRNLTKDWTIDKRISTLPEAVSTGLDEDRLTRMRGLLFPTDKIVDMVPARDHPVWALPAGGHTYPNEEFAENAILRLFPGTAREIIEDPYRVEPGHSTILLGASISNRATRLVLGEKENPQFFYRHSGFKAEFQYSVKSLRDQVVTRLQDGNPEWKVPNNAIVDRDGNYVAVPEYDGNRKLRTDFLLVTRIPRELGGSDQLIFSPAHGPGMRAVEKLLFEIPPKDFESLLGALQGEAYFQAIFEVGDLYEEGGTTHPGSLRLMTKHSGSPRIVQVRSA